MYKLKDIQRVHIEVSEICNAACPMCSRFIGGGRQMVSYMNNASISFEKFKQIFDLDFIEQNKKWVFCGVLGDPCTAKDLIPIIEHITKYNSTCEISVESNAGYRDTKWWANFGSFMNTHNRQVIFSIDGLKDTNHIYRRNVQWERVEENLKSFIDAGGYAVWQFIRFKHNEHQIAEAKALANKLGVVTFYVKETNRFRKQHEGEHKYPVKSLGSNDVDYWLYPPSDFVPAKLDEKNLDSVEIKCLAQQRKEIYVSAKGDVYPCCYIFSDMHDNPKNYANWNLSKLSINDTNTLQDIVEGKIFLDITKTWNKTIADGRIKKCADICGVNNRVSFQAI